MFPSPPPANLPPDPVTPVPLPPKPRRPVPGMFALAALLPELPTTILAFMQIVGQALVLLSVALCLLRGAPVLVEFLRRESARSDRQVSDTGAR